MSTMIKRFVLMYNLGILKYPKALVALRKLRKDRDDLKNLEKELDKV
jgi:hypothetical protein